MANRLADEPSPYLRQHRDNPVDWYPWGDEAFEKARREGKLIFLSIGYSTCHWCHVMERESFEDEEVAALLNKYYVSIKVDREERPDIDAVYMAVCMAYTGSGGWPLNLILTPDKTPFFAGTYFPKEARYGRMGLMELLPKANEFWQKDPAKVRASGANLLARAKESVEPTRAPAELGSAVLAQAAQALKGSFDHEHGGFGGAPKFPRPHNLTFLLRQYRRTGDAAILEIVEKTLKAMRRGGIYDHLGGGVHRYSTDAGWLTPHFEKMLYDQAGLALAYGEAFQVTGHAAYARTLREVLDYVLRDMTDPGGGFYSAEDADSEGEEGKFYLWTRGELDEVLGPQEAALFAMVYGVTVDGNYLVEATRQRNGTNILNMKEPVDAWASKLGVAGGRLERRLSAAKAKLFEARGKRIRPHRDDKVLTGWNGLMISALSEASRILDEPRYAEAAERAADFILREMRDNGRLLRRYRAGEAAVNGFAEDHAFLAQGLLDLYRATYNPLRLEQALELSTKLVENFWDAVPPGGGGLFDSGGQNDTLVLRTKNLYDGAIPSANSVALGLFARLYLLTGELKWRDYADRQLRAFSGDVIVAPAAYTRFIQGVDLLVNPTREVVVTGEAAGADTAKLLEAVRRVYAPETLVLFRPTGASSDEGSTELARLAPFLAQMGPVGGRAAAYVCRGFACQEPITDAEALEALLEKSP